MESASSSVDKDQIEKLRALTDAKLDESVAVFLLEISDGSIQAAAAHYREQQGFGQAPAPAPEPAPNPTPPPISSIPPSRRTSTATSTISSSTSQQRRRRTTKVTAPLTSAVRDTISSAEPGMSLGSSGSVVGPTGIVRGRDRGFAKNSHTLDERVFHEPRMFLELNSSATSTSSPYQMEAAGFSTPGAFDEREEGDGYFTRQRRDPAFAAVQIPSVLAGGLRRQTSEEPARARPMGHSPPRRCGTDSTRQARQQQLANNNNNCNYNRDQWTGRNIMAKEYRQESTMSIVSDISMNESCFEGLDEGGKDYDAEEPRSSFSSMPKEPPSSYYNGDAFLGGSLNEMDLDRKMGADVEGKLHASEPAMKFSSDLGGYHRDSSERRLRVSTASRMQYEPTIYEELEQTGSNDQVESKAKADPPGDIAREASLSPPKASKPRAALHEPDMIKPDSLKGPDIFEPSNLEEPNIVTPSDIVGNKNTSQSNNANNLAKKARRAPATKPGVVSVSNNPEEQNSIDDSQSTLNSAAAVSGSDGKVRRAPATRPGAVSVSNPAEESTVSEPSSSGPSEPTAKVRRAPATAPGAVSMTNNPEEPGLAKNSNSDVKVRRAPVSKPGAVSVSNQPQEPSLADVSHSTTNSSLSSPSGKVRRSPASRPGAVSVSNEVEEPLSTEVSEPSGLNSATSDREVLCGVEEQGTKDQNAECMAGDSLIKDKLKRRQRATTPGAVMEAGDSGDRGDNPSVASFPSKDSKVRRARASAPGAVSVGPEEPIADSSRHSKSEVQPEPLASPAGKRRTTTIATEPGIVMVTTSESNRADDRKGKEKAGLGKSQANRPGVVMVAGTDEKLKKKKETCLSSTKPGAVSVPSSSEAGSDGKKLAGLRSKEGKSSVISSKVTANLDKELIPGAIGDPVVEKPEDDPTVSSQLSHPWRQRVDDGSSQPRSPKRNEGPRVPAALVASPRQELPADGMPINQLSSAGSKDRKPKKGFFAGLFKKKEKPELKAMNEDLDEFENDLARIGSSRPMPPRRSMQSS